MNISDLQLLFRGDISTALLFVTDVLDGNIARSNDRSEHNTSIQNFKKCVSDRIPLLVGHLIDNTIDGLPGGKLDELIDHYKRNIYVAIKTCISTSEFHLLYNHVFSSLSKDPLCRTIFLEFIEG